jgi:hypothetical protein
MKAIDYVTKAKSMLKARMVQFPDFPPYLDIQAQLDYVESVMSRAEKDKSKLHKLTLGIYAGKEFEQSDPELAECLSDVNYIASQMARGLKVELP